MYRITLPFLMVLAYFQQPRSGVIVIHRLPGVQSAATAGKMVSDPATYDDSQEARTARVEEAKANSKRTIVVQIDDSKKNLGRDKNIVFDNLDLQRKHLFKSYDAAGKVTTSFYFSFTKNGSDTLHLHFDSGYANWRFY